MSNLNRYFIAAIAIFTTFSMGGCATSDFLKQAPPVEASRPIVVKVASESLFRLNDVPMGVYKIPETQVTVAGQGSGAGALFGVAGMLVSGAINAAANANAMQEAEEKLRINLDSQVNRLVALDISSSPDGRFTQSGNPGSATLLMSPAVVLTFVSEGNVLPFVVVKAQLNDAGGKVLWTGRYNALTGAPRPLVGAGSWTEQNGAALDASITASLQKNLRSILNEVRTPQAREGLPLVTVQARFPYTLKRLETYGYKLAEDDTYLTMVPLVSDMMVFSGVNSLDKKNISFRDTRPGDSHLKVVSEPEAPSKRAAAPLTQN